MFEDSLLESTGRLRTRDRRPAILAFTIQAVLATAVLTLPMLHPEVVPLHLLPPTLFAPAVPKPPTPPPTRVHVDTTLSSSPQTTPSPQTEQLARQTLPSLHPIHLPGTDEPLATTINIGAGMDTGNLPAALGNGNGTGTAAVSVTPKASPAKPFAISTGVEQGLLLAPIRPLYPAIARAAHVEGTVEVHAIISRTGHVESAEAVRGPEMLRGAALEAVRSARYRPFLLNGQPTEVETTFSIIFRLNS